MNLEAFLSPYVFLTMIMGVLVFYTQWFEYPISNLKPLPGPRAWSIFGNLPQLITAKLDVAAFHEAMRKIYGAVFGYRLNGRNVVVISDEKLVREAADHPDLCGRFRDELHENFAEEVNVGILTSYGQTWKEHHEVLSDFEKELSKDNQLEDICSKESTTLVNQLRDKAATNHRYSVQALASIFLQVIFGKTEVTIFKEVVDIIMERQERAPSAIRSLLPSYVTNLSVIAARRRRFLDASLVDLVKALLGDKSEQAGTETSCFMKKYRAESQKKIRNMGEGGMTTLTNQNLLWACLDLMVTCIDEASIHLSQTLLMLACHSDVLAKILEDIEAETKRLNDRKASGYLGAVQLESRRLVDDSPWNMTLMALSDVTLGGGEFEIPQGAVVVANGRYLRRRCAEESAVRDLFVPERFLEKDGSLIEVPNSISFPSGERACPAERISSTVSSILLRDVCKRFKLTLPSGTPNPFDSNGLVQRGTILNAKLSAITR